MSVHYTHGYTYEFPVRLIMKELCDYYAGVDGIEIDSPEYETLWNETEECDIIDWLHNNFDVSDYEDQLVLVSKVDIGRGDIDDAYIK